MPSALVPIDDQMARGGRRLPKADVDAGPRSGPASHLDRQAGLLERHGQRSRPEPGRSGAVGSSGRPRIGRGRVEEALYPLGGHSRSVVLDGEDPREARRDAALSLRVPASHVQPLCPQAHRARCATTPCGGLEGVGDEVSNRSSEAPWADQDLQVGRRSESKPGRRTELDTRSLTRRARLSFQGRPQRERFEGAREERGVISAQGLLRELPRGVQGARELIAGRVAGLISIP